MRIECPSCGAAYEVPESVMTGGRLLRCAQCARDWTPQHSAPEAAEAFEETAASQAPVAPPAPPVSSMPATPAAPGQAAVLSAWAASFVVLTALGWSAVTWRGAVMHLWPPSARLYAVLGFG